MFNYGKQDILNILTFTHQSIVFFQIHGKQDILNIYFSII